MTAPSPSVAAILTCYNEGPFIGEAVRSILEQTAQAQITDIVIADDGSAPHTVAVLKDIQTWDPRINVIFGAGGNGLPAQRNLAIGETNATFLAILDGDDIWCPEKIEKQLAAAASDEGVGLVYSDYYAFSDDGLGSARAAGILDLTHETHLSRAYFLNDPPIIPSTVLIRRSFFEAVGGFDASIKVFEDTDMWLRLARVSTFRAVNEPLIYKRYRGASITGGRTDLMAHHAFVAFKAAADEPALLPLVPSRLAERARKLGNHRFVFGDDVNAARLLRLSVKLNPFNLSAWGSLLAVQFFPRLIRKLLGRKLEARRQAFGVTTIRSV